MDAEVARLREQVVKLVDQLTALGADGRKIYEQVFAVSRADGLMLALKNKGLITDDEISVGCLTVQIGQLEGFVQQFEMSKPTPVGLSQIVKAQATRHATVH